MVDLGNWMGGAYVLSRPINPETDQQALDELADVEKLEQN
jgi:hypothetical protein